MALVRYRPEPRNSLRHYMVSDGPGLRLLATARGEGGPAEDGPLHFNDITRAVCAQVVTPIEICGGLEVLPELPVALHLTLLRRVFLSCAATDVMEAGAGSLEASDADAAAAQVRKAPLWLPLLPALPLLLLLLLLPLLPRLPLTLCRRCRRATTLPVAAARLL
ncbi:MAG: hypothetical protein ACK4ZJ_17155, partial [Allorhizobium sp.]